MIRKMLVVACCAILFASAAVAAETWFVATNGVDAAGRGTEAAPFLTLQYAHDAASAGDTVKVFPGVYDKGESYFQGTGSYPVSGHANRLTVTKKLFFEAVGGRGSAEIVGRHSATTASGRGPDAIRCVLVAATAYGTTFKNFTLRDGATDGDQGASGGDSLTAFDGGGLGVEGAMAYGPSKASNVYKAYLIDCNVINCSGYWGGGMYGGTAIRCLLKNCRGVSWGQTATCAALWNSVIVGNVAEQADRPTIGNDAIAVNCTFFGCTGCGAGRWVNVYNCNFCYQEGAEVVQGYTRDIQNTYGAGDAQYSLFAPAVGDFRLIAGTKAENGGLTDYLLNAIVLPAGTEMTDFNGNPIDTTKTTCDAGAVQGAKAAAFGRLNFPEGATVDGCYNLRVSYAYADHYPQFAVYESPAAKFCRVKISEGIGASGEETSLRYPLPDGTVSLCYPPSSYSKVVDDCYVNEFWADPAAVAATADGTAEHPFRTLQAAMDHLTANSVSGLTLIRARRGDYAEDSAVLNGANNRVAVPDLPIVIRAEEGAAVTTIRGEADSDNPDPAHPGCGPNAMRCLAFDNAESGKSRAVIGFTLEDGHSDSTPRLSDQGDAGGVINCVSSMSANRIQLTDCRVKNSVAVRNSVRCGYWSRCTFEGCHSDVNVFSWALLSGCFVAPSCSCLKTGSWTLVNTVTIQCTCPGVTYYGSYGDMQRHYGSVFGAVTVVDTYDMWGSVFDPDSWGTPNATMDFAKSDFADVSAVDYRLLNGTPITGAGKLPDAGSNAWTMWAQYYYAPYASAGLGGDPIRINADGVPMAGCYQKTVNRFVVSAMAGGLVVEPTGRTVFAEGETVTVSKGADGVRNCLGLTVNGATNLFAETPSVVFEIPSVLAKDGILDVAALYSPDWYVNSDPAVGDDGNDGFTPETPKRTLVGAMAAPGLIAGDTVHAAAGVYAENSQVAIRGDETANTKARVVVPAGVTLVADEGTERTFIVGEPDGTAANGLGPDAVRGAFLASGARLRGFTVTGGYTDALTDTTQSDWVVDYHGGGVCGHLNGRDDVFVEDCVISNNCAYMGGGISFLNAVRCKILDNRALANGGALSIASAFGCVINRSRQGSSYKEAACHTFTKIEFCTIGPDNRTFNGTGANRALDYGSGATAFVHGSLVLGDCGFRGGMTEPWLDSIIRGDPGQFTLGEGSRSATAAETQVDADLRPVIGANVAVDCGKVADATHTPLDFDADGVPRIMNGGRIDIGALEGEWRPVYAKDLSKSGKFAVVSADPSVQESDGKTVAIPDAASVQVRWTNASDETVPYSFAVDIPEGGVLTVLLNGDPLQTVSTPGRTTVRFANDLSENLLSFAYAGTGAAELVSTRREIGMALMIR